MSKLADELEGLADGATPGPWVVEPEALVTHDPVEVAYERRMIADLRYFTIPHADGNAALIAAVRNRLPAILSALRRVEKLEAALEPFVSAASVLEKVNRSIKDGDLINIEMGDLRAARQALTGEA